MGLKKDFETAVVNEPAVFEPLNFDCIFILGAVSAILFLVVATVNHHRP